MQSVPPSSDPPDLLPPMATSLDSLADWRWALARDLVQLERFLADADVLAPAAAAVSQALRQRLVSDKLVVAFVAEFSRGKSELINAIFFADAGRRILPATPGRTTMCPVELSWDDDELPTLDLLPIETRASGTLAEWREKRDLWRRRQIDPDDVQALAQALAQVTQTRRVSREQAQALGLWSDDAEADNPPTAPDGQVEIPAWRHAIINYPHPLLQRGLVVIDTPGLNAIGTEPELTLGLLPSAHAALFVLGADTGVTRSDLEVWSHHLAGQGLDCFVVLNKVDTLADPLATPEEQAASVERQCLSAAQTLGIERARVFPVSARQALAARLAGDVRGLLQSRLPALESALNADLLPRRQAVLAQAVVSGVQSILDYSTRRLRDQRRHNAELMLELRGLRGKSAGRVAQLLERVGRDDDEFERSSSRLLAMRTVHSRMHQNVLKSLSDERVREVMQGLQAALNSGWINMGARAAFARMCSTLQGHLETAIRASTEVFDMLQALFTQLNAEFGFTLGLTPVPDLGRFKHDLGLIESSYARYFGLMQTARLGGTDIRSEQFQRMLGSKLQAVFETASREVEIWHQITNSQIDSQLRDRRRDFKRRKETLDRIQHATESLEQRLAEVETQDAQLMGLLDQAQRLAADLCARAEQGPALVTVA
jgi:Dynamin family